MNNMIDVTCPNCGCEIHIESAKPNVHDLLKDADYIRRQAAIDALEKVAALFPWKVPGNRDSYDRYNEAWNDAIGRAEIEIEALPSAQPEIVRCGECKYMMADGRCYEFADDNLRPSASDFCSAGVRK